MERPPRKLLDQVRDTVRRKHYSIRTEATYCDWIRRYILFHGKKHPKDMGAAEIERFLIYLAVDGNVAASTQNQALCALLTNTTYRHERVGSLAGRYSTLAELTSANRRHKVMGLDRRLTKAAGEDYNTG